MQKLKVHFKISSVANASMAARCPNGDLPMIVGFIGVRRRPAGAPPVTAGPPADRRRAIARKFCHLQSEYLLKRYFPTLQNKCKISPISLFVRNMMSKLEESISVVILRFPLTSQVKCLFKIFLVFCKF